MSTQSQANVTLSKTGRDYGTWAGRTGGEVDRNVSDYYPGGMQPAKKLFAVPTTGDVTVRKLLADLTDEHRHRVLGGAAALECRELSEGRIVRLEGQRQDGDAAGA
jgi:hypothetical protein